MIWNIPRPAWRALVLALCFVLAACAGRSPQTSFYQLVPLADLDGDLPAVSPHDVSVGVGPLTIPDYLKRPQLVTRLSSSQIKVEEFHRWAGLLEKEIGSVMVDNLTELLGSERVVTFPWDQFARPDYRVVYDIQRFDGIPGGEAVLKVRWTVFDTASGKAGQVHGSVYRRQLETPEYQELVEAQSRLLGDFCRELAAWLLKVADAG